MNKLTNSIFKHSTIFITGPITQSSIDQPHANLAHYPFDSFVMLISSSYTSYSSWSMSAICMLSCWPP